jgi:hypothetical protein
MTHATADFPLLLNDASSEEEVQSCDAGLRGVVLSKSEQHKKVQGANYKGPAAFLNMKTSTVETKLLRREMSSWRPVPIP